MKRAFVGADKTERNDAANDGKYGRRQNRRQTAGRGVKSEEFQRVPASHRNNVLLLCAGKIANDGVGDGRGGLQLEIVQMHLVSAQQWTKSNSKGSAG
jgi:hypothetical protein